MDNASNLRPRNVAIAVAILCVVQIYDLVSAVSHVHQFVLLRQISAISAYATVELIVCVNLFLIYEIFEHCNWARITYLLLFLVGILAEVTGFIALFDQPSIGITLDLFSSAAEAVALFLLFTRPSNRWFKN